MAAQAESGPSEEDMKKLWDHCQGFFDRQRITCAETIYQSDRVILNAATFIEGVGDIIGYTERDDG